MPLSYEPSAADRAAFVAHMEVAVQSFVRRKQGNAEEPASGSSASSGPSSAASSGSAASSSSATDAEDTELMALLKLSNREVLRVELGDARHRAQRHRERARWLEAELVLAEKKSEMWRGATPASEADRINQMQRELNFLELANRLRERLGDQRQAAQLLKRREKAIEARLATLRESG